MNRTINLKLSEVINFFYYNNFLILNYLGLFLIIEIWRNHKKTQSYLKIVIFEKIFGEHEKENTILFLLYLLIYNKHQVFIFFNHSKLSSNPKIIFLVPLLNNLLITIFIVINFLEAFETIKNLKEYELLKKNTQYTYAKIIDQLSLNILFFEEITFFKNSNIVDFNLENNEILSFFNSTFCLYNESFIKKTKKNIFDYCEYLEKIKNIDYKKIDYGKLGNFIVLCENIQKELELLILYTSNNKDFSHFNLNIGELLFFIKKISNYYIILNSSRIKKNMDANIENVILNSIIIYERLIFLKIYYIEIDYNEYENFKEDLLNKLPF